MNPIYEQEFLPCQKAWELYTHCCNLNWLNEAETRREYFMSHTPREYTYGKGKEIRTYSSTTYSPEVAALETELNQRYKSNYNVCFLNRYDGQHQHLGWHADDSPNIDQSHPIAVISVGDHREI